MRLKFYGKHKGFRVYVPCNGDLNHIIQKPPTALINYKRATLKGEVDGTCLKSEIEFDLIEAVIVLE